METLKDVVYGIKKKDMKMAHDLFKVYSGKINAVCIRYAGENEEAAEMCGDVFSDFFIEVGKNSYAGQEGEKILKLLKSLAVQKAVSKAKSEGFNYEYKKDSHIEEYDGLSVERVPAEDSVRNCYNRAKSKIVVKINETTQAQ